MTNYLDLLITYQGLERLDTIRYDQSEIKISPQQILKRVKDFVGNECRVSISSFLNVYIEIKGTRQNLFKLRKKGVQLRLTESQDHRFKLMVFVEDGSQKNNIIKNFQHNYDSYQRLKNNLDRMMKQSNEQQNIRVEKGARPIDIAYIFSDPLVCVKTGTKLKNKAEKKVEVSYQVQYDQFIDMVKNEEFQRNFRIQMMVATETNIKNTLLEGVLVLHFSCHGNKNGCLEIQNQKRIGELALLEPKRLQDMISMSNHPKIIIFNVCHSYQLAKLISQSKKILTIGYKGEAKDWCCQKFTKQFYKGFFKDRKSVREIFNQIKKDISEKHPQQGNKLSIFPQQQGQYEVRLSEPEQQNLDYVVKWRILQSLRDDDSLGVKQQMFKIIRQFIINNQSMSYLFIEGDKKMGKTNLMMKTKIYTINRKIFTDFILLDLRLSNQHEIETLFQMKLDLEPKFQNWKKQIENKYKNERVSSLIIIDHCQNLIRYQYREFARYIEQKIKSNLKYGKIVILTRKVIPNNQYEANIFKNAVRHIKMVPDINDRELNPFISRYFDDQYKLQVERLRSQKKISNNILLVKALKRTKKACELQSYLKRQQHFSPEKVAEFIEQTVIQTEIEQINQSIFLLLKEVHIQVVENHHIYLSTILQEVADKFYSHDDKKKVIEEQHKRRVSELVKRFKYFIERIFNHQEMIALKRLEEILKVSLRIAGLCYLSNACFRQHLLNCEKLRVMANSYYSSLIYKKQEVQEKIEKKLVQYRLKILLTSYTYFTECHHRLINNQNLPEQTRMDLQRCSSKIQIVLDELHQEILKKYQENQKQMNEQFINKYQILNQIVQQLHYHPKYKNTSHQNHNIGRRGSNIYALSADNENYAPESIQRIHEHHLKIKEYWQNYEKLKTINSLGRQNCFVLSKDSMVILYLNIIRLIAFNQTQLQYLQSKGQSFFKQQMQNYVQFYVMILSKIDESAIFPDHKQSHGDYKIWNFHINKNIKLLFKKYFTLFINVYFQLQKIRQTLTKDYSLKIYNSLLRQCDIHKTINMISIKNDIQTHKTEQFLSNYCCQTYISMPLVLFKNIQDNIGNKINLKRFESHIFNFQDKFFLNLDRQIKHNIYLLEDEVFKIKQSPKSVIQLYVVDCWDCVVACQSVEGRLQKLKLRQVYNLPNSPVVIIFGVNSSNFINLYNEKGRDNSSVVITFDLDESDRPSEKDFIDKDTGKETWQTKIKRITELQSYATKLEITFTILQYFYTSFCKHFFTVDHSTFLEQVKNSFHLARAETFIKTKIRFQKNSKYQYSDYIKQNCKRIDLNINGDTLSEIKNKPAYHFMFKQDKVQFVLNILGQQVGVDKNKRQIQGQIGCNKEIYTILRQMKQQYSCKSFVIIYKSQQMLQYFLNTLKCKLKKQRKYQIEHDIINSKNLYQNRLTLMKKDSDYLNERERQANLEIEKKVKVIFYQNLSEQQFQTETKSISKTDQTFRLFLSQKTYIRNPYYYQQYLQETYNAKKLEYELFFIDGKSLRSNNSEKALMNGFKSIIQRQSASLFDIKTEVLNRNQ